MSKSKANWYCPHCSQASTRHWNLKTHIRRKHQGKGEPIGEDEWHFTPTTTPTTMHFIPDMMSLQNNNNYGLNSQVHPMTFSTAYHKKEEDTYKKRDLLEEIIQLWRPKVKQIKEILEIRNLVSQIQYASSQQQQQQPVIGSIPVGGFSLPSSIDELASPPPPPPMTFTPETDPLKDRIIGYTGFVCETCLANVPLAIYHFKENGKQVSAGHFCVPDRFLKMQGVVVKEKQNIINDLHRTLSEEIKKAVKVWTNNENIYLISRRLPRIPENNTGFATLLPSNIDKDHHWARRLIKENQILLNDNELLDYIRSANNKTFEYFYIQVNQDKQPEPYFMFISKDPILPRLEHKSLLLYDEFVQQVNSHVKTLENDSNHILDRSDSGECISSSCNDEGYGIGEGEDDDGKGVIEPESKPSITTVDDTQCPKNTVFGSTSNQCNLNIGECLQGKVRGEEEGGFSAKMPGECTRRTEIEDEEDPNELIQDAMEYLKKGDYINAAEYSEKAIAINPRIALAYDTKGQALFNLKKYNDALTCYEKAIELRPKYIEALYNKGLTLAAIGNHDKAIESFNQSIELNPNDADIWNSKGLSFNALGQYNEAIDCCDRAIKLNPSHNEALNNKDIAISNLRRQQQQQQEQQQQTQTRSSSSTDIDNTIAAGTKDPETVTKEIVEEHNKWIGEPMIERDRLSSQLTEYASCPVKKEQHQEKSYATVNKYPKQKNLKLVIPFIIVAVVIGSVIAFAVFSTTITTTPAKIFSNMTEATETTTTLPSERQQLNQQYSFVRS
jgi:tetratricopeptide (TPR) repeat protein